MKIEYDVPVDKVKKHYVVSQYKQYIDELRDSEHESMTFNFDTVEEATKIQNNLSLYIHRHEIYDIYCKRISQRVWLIREGKATPQ